MQNWDVGELVYRVSMLLLYPTLTLLGLGFLRAIWHLGETVQDAWALRAHRKPEAARQLRDVGIEDQGSVESYLLDLAASCRQHPQLRRFAALLLGETRRKPRETLPARVDHLVGRVEAALAQDVNRMRVSVRLGPLLGLVGTLIPLGPGLMALNEGDIGRLSSQLVVAFSTTVVGLLIGGISYALALVRAHTADLVSGDIELVSDLVCTLLKPHSVEGSRECDRDREDEEFST
jgi:biopolymer transport protein ExbB/TolQ